MKDNIKGFTLLELMITIGILSIVLGNFTLYFSSQIRFYFYRDNDIELKQDARIALDRIVSKVRSKDNLAFGVGSSGEGIIYEGPEIVINTVKNEHSGEIYYDYDNNAIRDSEGNKISGNIKDFKLEKDPALSLIKITILCGNSRATSDREYSTAVRMY